MLPLPAMRGHVVLEIHPGRLDDLRRGRYTRGRDQNGALLPAPRSAPRGEAGARTSASVSICIISRGAPRDVAPGEGLMRTAGSGGARRPNSATTTSRSQRCAVSWRRVSCQIM